MAPKCESFNWSSLPRPAIPTMPRPKFSIGIDLGTTNCAMAFEPLGGAETRTQVFAIPQWEKPGTRSEHATLPSFLYLPAAHEAAGLGGAAAWVPGRFARKQVPEWPGGWFTPRNHDAFYHGLEEHGRTDGFWKALAEKGPGHSLFRTLAPNRALSKLLS